MKFYELRRKFWDAITPKKKHPYLDKAGITTYPDNHWGGGMNFKGWKNALRQRRRARKYGFDPRDCWDLDDTFYLWLYEHLCLLLDDTNADLTWRTFEHNGKTYTEGEYIEYLKKLCLDMINFDEFKGCPDLEWHTEPDPDYKDYNRIVWDNTEEELEANRVQSKKNYEEKEALRKELIDVFYELMPSLWW